MKKQKIYYATSNAYKMEEIGLILESTNVVLGKSLVSAHSIYEIEFVNVPTYEPLMTDLSEMVKYKASSAYKLITAPCIVEHAGLIAKKFINKDYLGGLTQPTWDALGPVEFVRSLRNIDAEFIARAVVGYCDGLSIQTFVGETAGTLVETPVGTREFYWDTVFSPDGGGGMTYAQLSDQESGLIKKIELSQSTKALRKLLEYLSDNPPELFRR